MPRTPRRSFAIWWLLLIHALADAAVGLYRAHDLHRETTDVLSAALGRGQLCLLAAWLAAGADRLWWRVCGLIGGAGLIFVVFSRTALPGRHGIGAGSVWLEEEWAYYFRLSAPGDLLVKAPVLLLGVGLPLAAWRVGRAVRSHVARSASGAQEEKKRPAWPRCQFGFAEAAAGMLALSVALAAVFRTAPYEEWFGQLAAQGREFYRAPNAAAVYSLASGWLYAGIALVSLWAVYGKTALRFRAPLAGLFILAPAYAFEAWLESIAVNLDRSGLWAVWPQSSAETLTAALAAAMMIASLLLDRLYSPK